jgi:hypothetical protein
VVGIKITYKDGVVLGVEKSVKVGGVLCQARGVGGEVDVGEISGLAIELHPDPVNLQGAVIEVGEVEGGVGNGVMDKEGHTSTRTTYKILPDEGIARERFRIGF